MNKSLKSPQKSGSDKQFFLMQFDIIKDIAYLIKKYWIMMLSITIVFGALSTAYMLFMNSNTGSISISFNYSEIGEGKNPDGTRFNIYELISDDVLNEVVNRIDASQKELSVDYLRNKLTIIDKMTYTGMDSIEKSIVSGYENYTYHPSEFIVSYSQASGRYSASLILETLARVYREYFINNHVDNTEAITADFSDIADLDYINGIDKLGIILDSMNSYVQMRQKENSKFVSTSTGLSFNDLGTRIQETLDIDLPKFQSYVVKSSLSKDRPSLLKQYEYTLRDTTTKRNNQDAVYRTAMEGLDIYDQTVTKVVFIPSYDKDNEFYMSRTNTGIDYLTELSSDKMFGVELLSKKISNYQYLVKSFGGDAAAMESKIPVKSETLFGSAQYVDSGVQEAYDESTGIRQNENDAPISYEDVPTQLENHEEQAKIADEMMNDIIVKTRAISNDARSTESDYIQNNKSCYPSFRMTSFGSDAASNVKYFILGFAASFVAAYIMVLTGLRVIRRFTLETKETKSEGKGE